MSPKNPPLFSHYYEHEAKSFVLDTEITLRDLIAMFAPMPDEQAWSFIGDREQQRRVGDPRRLYTTPSRLDLASEYRYEVADAMLRAREKKS